MTVSGDDISVIDRVGYKGFAREYDFIGGSQDPGSFGGVWKQRQMFVRFLQRQEGPK